MTTLNTSHSETAVENPVSVAEEIAGANEWTYERHSEDELTLFLNGQYTDMQFRLMWREDYKTLQFACLYDLKVQDSKLADIYHAVGLMNERMWIGHFEYWAEEEALLFRHASLANEPMGGYISEDHIVTMLETAISECERFYPVFQFIMWGGQSPTEAIETAMLDCMGSA